MVTRSENGTTWLWNGETGKPITSLDRNDGVVLMVVMPSRAFSRMNRVLFRWRDGGNSIATKTGCPFSHPRSGAFHDSLAHRHAPPQFLAKNSWSRLPSYSFFARVHNGISLEAHRFKPVEKEPGSGIAFLAV